MLTTPHELQMQISRDGVLQKNSFQYDLKPFRDNVLVAATLSSWSLWKFEWARSTNKCANHFPVFTFIPITP